MTDFRSELYRQYVTSFKSGTARLAGGALRDYWTWCDHTYLPWLVELSRSGSILELGCGPGHLLTYLRRRGFSHVVGIDLSEQQVRACRDSGVATVVADAVPFLESCPSRFAAIIAVDFFEHFTKDELVSLMARIRAALRPGGLLLVQTANGAGLLPGQVIYGDLTHMTVFTPDSLAQLLRVFGFDSLAFAETGPVAIRLRGRLDVLLWWAIKVVASFVRRIETGKRQAVWTENFICRARLPTIQQ